MFKGLYFLIVLLAPALSAADWQVQVVDQSGPGQYSSLKIDRAGNAHLAYVVDDGQHYPLKYAFWDHSAKRWFVMTVAEGASFCSLVLDSKQHPHISYNDFGTMSGNKLRYAYWDGNVWKREAIPINADIISYYTSIALDPNDNPSISYYEYRGPKDTDIRIRMRVISRNGRYWTVRTIDPGIGSGKFNGMVADRQGHLHLAYANVNAETAGMRYAYWDGTSWLTQVFDGQAENDGDYVGYSAAITLDDQGNPHITYMDYVKPALKYAVKKDGHWHVQRVTSVGGVGYPDRNSIVVDHEGRPYIGYYDAVRGSLQVAHKDGDRWSVEVVDGSAAGSTSSLQIFDDELWISYTDSGGGGVKVAHRRLEPSTSATSQLITARPNQ